MSYIHIYMCEGIYTLIYIHAHTHTHLFFESICILYVYTYTHLWLAVMKVVLVCMIFGGLLIADEAALKSVWDDKGASGTKLCFMCQNVVSHSSDLHTTDATGTLVSHVCHHKREMVLHTDTSMLDAAKHLAQCRPLMNKGTFKMRQFALGLNYSEHGPLFAPELQEHLKPISMSMFDYMHNFVVGGVFHVEMTQLLQVLQNHGMRQDEMPLDNCRNVSDLVEGFFVALFQHI